MSSAETHIHTYIFILERARWRTLKSFQPLGVQIGDGEYPQWRLCNTISIDCQLKIYLLFSIYHCNMTGARLIRYKVLFKTYMAIFIQFIVVFIRIRQCTIDGKNIY